MPTTVFHEWYGDVTRTQLALYRRHNVSPFDHEMLEMALGQGRHDVICAFVREHTINAGYEAGRLLQRIQ